MIVIIIMFFLMDPLSILNFNFLLFKGYFLGRKGYFLGRKSMALTKQANSQ